MNGTARRAGFRALRVLAFFLALTAAFGADAGSVRGTGDLGIVIERASGRVHVVDTSAVTSLCAVDGLSADGAYVLRPHPILGDPA